MAKRRGKAEGGESKRRQSWIGGHRSGRSLAAGMLGNGTLYGEAWREATGRHTEASARSRGSGIMEPSHLTVGQELDIWLEKYAIPRLRRWARRSYGLMVRQHLEKTMAGMPPGELLSAGFLKTPTSWTGWEGIEAGQKERGRRRRRRMRSRLKLNPPG